MFLCETSIHCDICGREYNSVGKRMSDCICKARFRSYQKKAGWITIYGKYDVCKNCLLHYGKKEIYRMMKERENDG